MSVTKITCKVCGKEYRPCIRCIQYKNNFTGWRNLTDTEDHYKVFIIVKDFLNGADKETCRSYLEHVNITDKDSYKESIRNALDEIMKPDAEETVEEEVIEVPVKKVRKRKIINEIVENREESQE